MNRTGLLALIVLLLLAIIIALIINRQLSRRNQNEIFDAIEEVNTDKNTNQNDDDFTQITPDTSVEEHTDKIITITAEGAIYGAAGITEINSQQKLGLSVAQFGKSESIVLKTVFDALPLKQSNEEFSVWLFHSLSNKYLEIGLLSTNFDGKYENQFFTSKNEFDQYDSVLLSLDDSNIQSTSPQKTIAIGKYFISKQIIDEF